MKPNPGEVFILYFSQSSYLFPPCQFLFIQDMEGLSPTFLFFFLFSIFSTSFLFSISLFLSSFSPLSFFSSLFLSLSLYTFSFHVIIALQCSLGFASVLAVKFFSNFSSTISLPIVWVEFPNYELKLLCSCDLKETLAWSVKVSPPTLFAFYTRKVVVVAACGMVQLVSCLDETSILDWNCRMATTLCIRWKSSFFVSIIDNWIKVTPNIDWSVFYFCEYYIIM